ncbi:lysophospholipid acyltransferase family protein [Bartonella tamiae]|uniref:1-acylglycerol-3-phosphate O-acyltransferase n=1 Tax=Bartonella tamiae Th239 TaxID=1094558 RepID=J0R753_9HYPH|nr:1-acyl-sn-glycerol-3-phosphate acyltransferase [Bartonella tamiae]EJF91559.1 1-acylglycerol-3-phosphate O-acyltransferase [Bartonella tamiae Th239]EJF92457.1 1-acylglycerol-3-phosphate O-acyltransferase [Bartonella tamiae Th307]
MVLALRSILFTIAFYMTTLIQMIVYAPVYFLMPRKKAWIVPKTWARVTLFLQKYIAGTDFDIQGLDNLPQGAYIIAPKHQSAWETFGLVPFLDDPSLIMKRELTWIPLFGWYMTKTQIIPIDRGSPLKAMKTVLKGAKEKIKQQRQVLIFPEGTRRQPGAEPDYKPGILAIYNELNVPVVPIAHNAGLYWPRGNFRRYRGKILVRILPPIEAGLKKREFLSRLIENTEKACDELLVKAACSDNPPPMPPDAVKRLKELGVEWAGKTRKS